MPSPKHSRSTKIVKVDFIRNDYVWDLSVPEYENYWCEGVIHHNSSKSWKCARACVDALVHLPNTEIWAFHTSEENSVHMQQPLFYYWLPKEFKALGKSNTAYVKYSEKNGFTGASFILPNGSKCLFKNYMQDPRKIEGGYLGCKEFDDVYDTLDDSIKHRVHNIGAWGDELIPWQTVETLRVRNADHAAKLLVSFTPIEGYTPTVKNYLTGAKTLEAVEARYLDNEKVPRVQQCMNPEKKIVYFHVENNPYVNADNVYKRIDKARDEILCRMYGVPTRATNNKFPRFDDKVHIVPHNDIPFIRDRDCDVTYYHGIDPSGAKPWFMLWAGVTPQAVYIWAEWPDISYGQWADVTKGSKGRPGDAARPQGLGIKDYVDIMYDIEQVMDEEGKCVHKRSPLERLIDPKLSVAETTGTHHSTSILDDLLNEGLNVQPVDMVGEYRFINNGLQAINDRLSYDKSKPIDSLNHPKLYISDRCENLIYCMQEYTGLFGKDESTKDPVDVLRYLCISDIQNMDEDEFQAVTKRY